MEIFLFWLLINTIKSNTEINVYSPYLSSNTHVHQKTYSAVELSFALFNLGVELTNFGYTIAEYSNNKFGLIKDYVRAEFIIGWSKNHDVWYNVTCCKIIFLFIIIKNK